MSTLNINIGVMGHVDSGKTALCKCLSDVASTAAFDKNPQSQERGITIDLGFSCFKSCMPPHLAHLGYQTLQVTLVDCPGHASLLRTVIGGSNIIDMILLVIDAAHGIQVQTAECILLAEVLEKPVLVALNKVDLLAVDGDDNIVKKADKQISKLEKILSKTKLIRIKDTDSLPETEAIRIAPVSAKDPESCLKLKNFIINNCVIPQRSSGSFLFCVDHCFVIKGQGTVMTGTVIQGSLKIGDQILIMDLNETREVKSIQVFKKPVTTISQGDRAAILITRFNSKLVERALICSPNYKFKLLTSFTLKFNLIDHFKHEIKSGSRLSLSIGFEIVTVIVLFYEQQKDGECLYVESVGLDTNVQNLECLIKCERPIFYQEGSTVIALKLGADPKKKTCRIMLYGKLPNVKHDSQNMKIFVWRESKGYVERVSGDSLIVRDLFSKINTQKHIGREVSFSIGELTTGKGIIESGFGDSGKVKVRAIGEQLQEFEEIIKSKDKIRIKEIKVTCRYKKYRKIGQYL
ncbi:Selenocysteine-specific elongation factor [Thelohanellus kitauei]|uniref:Selenocysteine-specific elongation factor n=1 Tax=Thelohanellus kitauei TaxID=669202 RepID=A0A0C2N5C9_THEKT|nr:Selenocysteine-specific elongation factor [Thelohanellus kitauei]